MNIWTYIKADALFRDCLPHIKSHKYKIRGKNARNNPADFTPKEKQEIKNKIIEIVNKHLNSI